MNKMTQSSALITRRVAVQRAAMLLGGTISAPTLVAVLAGCERRASESIETTSALSGDQKELVSTIAEHIIPETDTPGAVAAGVPDFINVMLTEYYPAEERERFMRGLAEVNDRAQNAFGENFLGGTPEQQMALLIELDREAFAPPDPPPLEQMPDTREETHPGAGETPLPGELEADTIQADTNPSDSTPWIHGDPKPQRVWQPEVPFFRTMKELTLIGYYTSEPGATEELRHEPVPGRFQGCVPFAQIGRTWAV